VSGIGILVWEFYRFWDLRNISGIGILVYRVLEIWEFAKYVWNRNFSISGFTDLGILLIHGFRNIWGLG
jgi:hypothetical protein